MAETRQPKLEESIRSDASVSGHVLGKPGDESSSILINSVPAEIHGGPNANAAFGKLLDKVDKSEDVAAQSLGHAESSGSMCEHSKKLRRVHNPYGHSDHASSMKSSNKETSQGGGRKIELDKVSDDENTGAGQSSSFGSKGWQYQSKLGGGTVISKDFNLTEDSYENDDFDDFSLSATAGKLDKVDKVSLAAGQRQ